MKIEVAGMMNRLKKVRKKHLVIFLLLGIFLVYLSDFTFQSGKPKEIPESESDLLKNTECTERKLREIIESLEGVSDVSVFISYDNNGRKTLASQGEENSVKDGAKTHMTKRTQVVTGRTSSGEEPFVTEETMPRIRGIIIAAKGVGDKTKNALITGAVSSALDVPIHRVKVLSKD